mgnify:CR=1 FL=1
MARYGYQDMPEEYSDVDASPREAICFRCGRSVYMPSEECWQEAGRTLCDDLCSEYDDEHPDTRQNEW